MKLSEEEAKVLELVSLGYNNKEISIQLNYSIRTVARRIKKLLDLYKVKSRLLLAQEFLMEKL